MAISVNIAAWDYGNLILNSSEGFKEISITNHVIDVALISILPTTNYYASNDSFTIPGNSITNIFLIAKTNNLGAHNEIITVVNELDDDNVDVDLFSNIINPVYSYTVTPNLFAFGTILEGATEPTTTFTIQNTGNVALSFSLTDATHFIVTDPLTGFTLQPNASKVVTVKALTSTAGVWNENIVISQTSAGNQNFNCTSTINAITYTYLISPLSPKNFGTLTLGDPEPSQVITINNTGTGSLAFTILDATNFYATTSILNLPPAPSFGSFTIKAKTDVLGIHNENMTFQEANGGVANVYNTISQIDAVPDRTFTVVPTSHDFGDVDLNAIEPSTTYTITNTSPITLDFVLLDTTRFYVNGLSTFSILAAGTHIVTVNAKTDQIGSVNHFMIIQENGVTADDFNAIINITDPNNLLPVKTGLVAQFEDGINATESYLTAIADTEVTKWIDISGNSNHARVNTNGGTLNPQVEVVPTRGIRTSRIINDFRYFDSSTVETATGQKTVFYVGTKNKTGVETSLYTTFPPNKAIIKSRPSTGADQFRYIDTGASEDLGSFSDIDESVIIMVSIDASTDVIKGRVNGAATFTGTSLDDGLSTLTAIGGDSIGAVNFEFLLQGLYIYDTVLSISDVVLVENYLSPLYNVPLHAFIGAPTTLTATPNAGNVDLAWINSLDIYDTVHIERQEIGQAFVEIDTVTLGTIAYTDLTIDIDTFYTYRVRASFTQLGDITYSEYSNTDTAIVFPAIPLPPTSFISTTVTDIVISLGWTNPIDTSTFTNLVLERKLSAGPTFLEIATLTQGTTTYIDIDVLPETSYDYRLKAIWVGTNATQESIYTATLVVLTDNIAPPTNLTIPIIQSNLLRLNWLNPVGGNFTDTEIWAKGGAQPTFVKIAEIDGAFQAYDHTSRLPSTLYTYKIRSLLYNDLHTVIISTSDFTPEVSATTLDGAVGPPLPPIQPSNPPTGAECFSNPNIREIYVTPWTTDLDWNYRIEEDTRTTLPTEIFEFTGDREWFNITIEEASVDFIQNLEAVPQGYLLSNELTFAIGKNTTAKWNTLVDFLTDKYLVAFVDDNGSIWTFGFEFGADVTSYDFGSESAGFSILLKGHSKSHVLTGLSFDYYSRKIL